MFPVKLDNGTVKTFVDTDHSTQQCSRPLRWTDLSRCNKRWSKSIVNWDDVQVFVVAGIPYGGGNAVNGINLKDYSKAELERIPKVFWWSNFTSIIGEKDTIVLQTLMLNGQIMFWWLTLLEEEVVGKSTKGVFTGKPCEFGDLFARTEATGYGVNLTAKKRIQN